MKKTIIALGAALLTLAACNKVETAPAAQDLKLDLTISYGVPGTKAVKTGWENGDVVHILFGNTNDYDDVALLRLTYNDGKWSESWSEGLKEKLLTTTGGTFYAYYSPVDIGELYYDNGEFVAENYTFTWGLCSPSDKERYTIQDGVLSATVNMVPLYEYVYFYLPDVPAEKASSMKLKSECIEPVGFYSFWYDSVNTTATNTMTGYAYEGGVVFSGLLLAAYNGQEKEHTFTLWTDEESYRLTGTRLINYFDAIVLPKLDSGKWEVVKN